MATGGQTPNLNLIKWDPKDPLSREEFNNNFAKIDDAHKQVTEQMAQETTLRQSAVTELDSRKADKTEVNTLSTNKADKTEVNSLATAKADKSYVDTNISTLDTKINAQASGSPKGTYATLTALQTAFPTGNGNIYVVSADGKWYYWNGSAWTSGGTYQSTGIADKSVPPEKTTFIRRSRNFFNKNDVLIGYRIDATTGEPVEYEGWVVSGFIPVNSLTPFIKNYAAIISEYDSSKTYIASGSNNALPFNSRSNANFFRVSMDMSYSDLFQLELGSERTVYEDYGVVSDNLLGSKSDDSINKNVAGKLKNIIPFTSNEYPDKIFDITPDIALMSTGGVFIQKDYVNSWGNKSYGIKIGVTKAKTASITQTYSTPHNIPFTQAVGMWYYVDNPSNLKSLTVQLGHEQPSGYQWIRSDYTFKKGWNLFRHEALAGVIGNWTDFYRIRFVVEAIGAVNVTIGLLFLEQPAKAKLLFVEDGGYVEFLERGYPQLKARGIPTTWALNPGILGTARRITEIQVDELAKDYMSEFSFHSWASDVHSTMTSEQVADNAIKCVRWLQKKGLKPDYLYRAAITQNNAPNHAILQEIVDAYANGNEQTGTEIFPFANPYGTKRMTLHGMDSARIDEVFEQLKKTHALIIGYTHGIGETSNGTGQSTGDMTQAQWDYFISKVDTALAEGWLEGVTYDRLRKRYEKQSKGRGFEALVKATYI